MDSQTWDRVFRLGRRLLWNVPARIAMAVVFSLGLGWLAIRGLDWGEVADAFRGVNVWYPVLALVLFNAATVLRAYRWQVLFLGERVSLWHLFLVQNTGIGMNNLSPIRVVSEPMQFVMLTLRYRLRGGTSAATLGMERVLDMVASTALLATGLLFIPARGTFLPYVLAAFVIAAIAVALVVLFSRASRWALFSRVQALGSFARALARLSQARGLLGYSLFLSIIYWVAVGMCTWIASLGMDLGISPLVATLSILGTLYLTTSLPSLPMAAGTFEFAIVYVLGLFGVEQAAAFSYAVLIHALLYIPPTTIAIAVISIMGLRPRKELEESRATTDDASEARRREDRK